MNRHEENIDKAFESLLPSAQPQQVQDAAARVLQQLRSAREGAAEAVVPKRTPARRNWRFLAAAVVVLAVLGSAVMVREFYTPRSAFVETAGGGLYRIVGKNAKALPVGHVVEYGEVLRAGVGASAVLALADGSRVEMREQTELSLEPAADGVRIRLNKGGVIVNAAKQRAGHLYVQTREVTVSVVGTVFLVNAEEEGSRVAVIEGEVRVLQGAMTKNLLPGEQLTTNPRMEQMQVQDELSWSRHAEGHVALLQQGTAPAITPALPARLDFGAVSIRPLSTGEPAGSGFACRGVDGIRRADAGEKGNLSLQAPQGRCTGTVALARLIEFAYGVPHAYGPDTPEWTRPYTNPSGPPRQPDPFQIDAVAEDPTTVTTEQLRQMVQTMLTERFKLKSHREMRDVPGYSLVVAKNGTKLKPVSGEEELPFVDYSTIPSLGGPTLRGKTKVDKLIQFVNGFINPTGFVTSQLPSYVTDKTGLTGIYEYQMIMPVPGGAAGRSTNPVPQGIPGDRASGSFAWRGPAFAEAMKDQLGLEMKEEKGPIEILVVDHVEKPSEN